MNAENHKCSVFNECFLFIYKHSDCLLLDNFNRINASSNHLKQSHKVQGKNTLLYQTLLKTAINIFHDL